MLIIYNFYNNNIYNFYNNNIYNFYRYIFYRYIFRLFDYYFNYLNKITDDHYYHYYHNDIKKWLICISIVKTTNIEYYDPIHVSCIKLCNINPNLINWKFIHY